jgi:hypothetical protein
MPVCKLHKICVLEQVTIFRNLTQINHSSLLTKPLCLHFAFQFLNVPNQFSNNHPEWENVYILKLNIECWHHMMDIGFKFGDNALDNVLLSNWYLDKYLLKTGAKSNLTSFCINRPSTIGRNTRQCSTSYS